MLLVGPFCIFLGFEVILVLLLCISFKPIQSVGMALSKVLKNTYGGVVVKTVSGCISVLLISTLVSLWRLNERITTSSANFGSSEGVMVDQVEFFGDALEASLMGYSLLLILLIERLSESMKSCDSLKVNLEFLKKQAKGMESEYLRVTKESSGATGSDESAQGSLEKALKTTIGEMRTALESLKVQVDSKGSAAKKAEATSAALTKQTAGLQLEYERLQDENESLRAQLAVFDGKYNKSEDKKRS